jgi:hypothetical protein
MAFTDDSNPTKPVRKTVSDDYGRDVLSPAGDRDPYAMADLANMALRELYRNADEADVRIDSWTVTFSPDPDALFGESILTATATHCTRRPLRLTSEQMESEIMALLSKRRDD